MKKALAALTAVAAVVAIPASAEANGGEHVCPTVRSGPLRVMVFANKMTTCRQAEAVAHWNRDPVIPFWAAGQHWHETYAGRAGRGSEEFFSVFGRDNSGAGYGVELIYNLPVS
jgi:hypothetical protein